jgi:hypothetical protein
MSRSCGDCTLCCKLLPVVELAKGANERCKYQRRTGCRVYHRAGMPVCCGLWNCAWLAGEPVSRPDRSHCVIDILPDFVTGTHEEDGHEDRIDVTVIWVDPAYRDAWRTDEMRAYIERRAKEGVATLIRFNERDGLCVFAPPLTSDGKWWEKEGPSSGRNHTPAEIFYTAERARTALLRAGAKIVS